MNPNSSLAIQVIEAVPLEHLDSEAIQKGVTAGQKRIQESKNDLEKAEGEILTEVYQSMATALASK